MRSIRGSESSGDGVEGALLVCVGEDMSVDVW